MAPIKVKPDPMPRIWIDPLPRYQWRYEKRGRFNWTGDYGPKGLWHSMDYRAFTERGIRLKLARLIRRERRKKWVRYMTRQTSRK